MYLVLKKPVLRKKALKNHIRFLILFLSSKTNPNQRHKKMVDLNQGMRSMKLTEPEIVHNTNEETSQHESMNNTLQEEGEYELLHHSINNEDEIQNYEASYHSNDEIVIKLVS